jgi:glycosyltransferase involved in cell wall biosynthesis
LTSRVRTDGKFFAIGDARFPFRGVTYGTFRARESDGAPFPERDDIKRDFAAMQSAGFTVVRTYTAPPDDLLEVAADWGLRVLAGIFYPDWRHLVGLSRQDLREVESAARNDVRQAASRLAGDERVLGLSLGNEVPADVLRWFGASRIARVIADLATRVRAEDPEQLVTYANYPTAEYLPLEQLDFLTFNVFLERRQDFRKYLTRLQHLAGDRPLVLGELGRHVDDGPDGERSQAEALDWQLETAMERGVAGTCVFTWTDEWWVGDAAVDDWHFGLTRADRSPRPALYVAARSNTRTVRDLAVQWPSVSVVICAYNAGVTLDECLRHTCALDYPDLEILVVDDGSTDRTAEIAQQHPPARLLSIEHAGLSVARNHGLCAARGEIIAYLDSDAYPSPEWPYYLALGFDERTVAGAGGPNIAPPADPVGAQVVARSPGGPVHVLTADDRAEHIPGCNMAFLKYVLEEVGGCDPVLTTAGDDVDLCWKILDQGWEIGFHPAALVWHHRRSGLRSYLRQQRGYGHADGLLEARHPYRFSAIGTARWRGRIYNALVPSRGRQRVYRGLFGSAAYQSTYPVRIHALEISHQVGLPAAAVMMLTLPLAAIRPVFGLLSFIAVLGIVVLGAIDVVRASPPRSLRRGRLRFRFAVATHHVLQPLVRWWGRRGAVSLARVHATTGASLPGSVRRAAGGVLVLADDRPRADLAAQLVARLRRGGIRVALAGEWDDHDARLVGSQLVIGELITSSHPPGTVQLRIRRKLARRRLLLLVTACAALAAADHPAIGAVGLTLGCLDLAWGWWRTGFRAHRLIERDGGG